MTAATNTAATATDPFTALRPRLFGIAYRMLGVREFPSVDPPVISVSTVYTGAPPEVIESQITEPLEENLNAVAGIRSLSSISREGRSTITVEFTLGVEDLGFYDRAMKWVVEPGMFTITAGTSSTGGLDAKLEVVRQ